MNKKTVAVGLSGGVDSAMAAMLLMEQGYKVIGVTMSIWDENIPITESTKSGCFGPGEAEDLKAAANVCHRLGIEHHIIRMQNEYKDNVLSYFCHTYIDGKTPNPCLMCNARMKFGLLPAKLKEAGIHFDYFATGHYVRTGYNHLRERYTLLKALDHTKDQSYFLSFLQQDQLTNLLFPLGEKTKGEIKDFARIHGFTDLAEKQESQDFLETDDYSVLFEDGTFTSGEITDYKGKVLGKHRGLINYTIGQRRNLGISGQIEPYYVIKIDSPNNRIVVGPQSHLYSIICKATGINWLSYAPQSRPFYAKAKIRLQHDPADCQITPINENSAEINFDKPQLSITPGQGIVFYINDEVVAGGIIEKV